MADQLCDSGQWAHSGFSVPVEYLRDVDQIVRHDCVHDNFSSLIRIRLCRKSCLKSVLGLTARCMTRLQGGAFQRFTAAKQFWQGL